MFETTTLLEQLDEILLRAEKSGGWTRKSVNEIFRIMHTIKGSASHEWVSTHIDAWLIG